MFFGKVETLGDFPPPKGAWIKPSLGLASWLVSGLALNKYRCNKVPFVKDYLYINNDTVTV